MNALAVEKRLQAAWDDWNLDDVPAPLSVLNDAQETIAALREIVTEYAEHGSWRCAYRSRYGRCVCGLDEALAALELPPAAVHDPEGDA